MKNYQQQGHVMTWTNPGTAVVSGQVVKIGSVLGVATADIAAGAEGEVQLIGVFKVPKTTAAVIVQGDPVVFKASTSKVDHKGATLVSGDVSGSAAFAWEAAGNGTTEVAVKFTGIPGAVT